MSIYVKYGLVAGAVIFSVVCVVIVVRKIYNLRLAAKQRESLRKASGIKDGQYNQSLACDGMAEKILNYLLKISFQGEYLSKDKFFTRKFKVKSKLPQRIAIVSKTANMPATFGNNALRETQFRLAFCLGVIGGLLGVMFSNILGLILFVAGLLAGYFAPIWAMKQENNARKQNLEKALPEMLEVVALGMRSGLTFDRSLSIYTDHFDSEFSKACQNAQQKWTGGIATREEALKNLCSIYDSSLFRRVVENIIRSLRFGTSLANVLDEAASEARQTYKAAQEEQVAKAPVKMMFPTGTLILPAMLLMVMGPVLLELAGNF